MNVLKPDVSLNVSNIDASVALTLHDDPARTAAPCCAPSALPAQDKPMQLGKQSGCC